MQKSILLTKLHKGDAAVIIGLLTTDVRHLRKLMVFGVLPGTQIIVLQTSPAWVLQIGHTQLALDHEIADKILVSNILK